jgi:geranylgeranyl diphosphate synthase, type II
MAVLAGDVLLTLAFDAADRLSPSRADADLRLALVREAMEGTRAMIAGQVFDTLGGLPPGLSDEAGLQLVHRNKTGALIRAACRMGAMLGAGSGLETAALAGITRFAEDLGLIFQIVDDLLDVEGDPGAVGKATGKDAVAGKLTYPGVLGIEGSRAAITRLEADVEAALAPFGPDADPLRQLAHRMSRRDR